jgi:hypothetical protein
MSGEEIGTPPFGFTGGGGNPVGAVAPGIGIIEPLGSVGLTAWAIGGATGRDIIGAGIRPRDGPRGPLEESNIYLLLGKMKSTITSIAAPVQKLITKSIVIRNDHNILATCHINHAGD